MITLDPAAALPQVARERRTNAAAEHPTRPATEAVPGPSGSGSSSRSSVGALRRARTLFAATLSIGAGVIHLAAAASHGEPLGDLALGFYWAALFQIAFAVAFLAHPRSRRLARVGVGVNLALIGAWAWSRTIGLPTIAGGPEGIGTADATAVAFEILLVSLLAAPGAVHASRHLHRLRPARVPAITTPVLVAGIALLTLATSIAVADGLGGHGHDGGAAHSGRGDHPTGTALDRIESPHGHDSTTAH